MNSVQIEDYKEINALSYIDWKRLEGKTILVTGSTGLIGSNLVNALIYVENIRHLGIKLVLPVRNVAAAWELFGEEVKIIPYTLGDKMDVEEAVDYIVHLASPTSSKYFTEKPVDTLTANIEGVKAVLELAKEKKVKKLVYLSTMEVYGFPKKGHIVKENEVGAFETMNARNSYPIAKIACEALCNSYWIQYGVPAVVLRATQTFGPGVKYDDGRVFAQFMRCVVEKKDIVLKSAGHTERSYLYTADAVSAIIVGLINGGPGESYSVANPETYCSIRDMAKIVTDNVAGGTINIVYEIADDITKLGYAETIYMKLGIEKIQLLGWKPSVNLADMFTRMIDSCYEMS